MFDIESIAQPRTVAQAIKALTDDAGAMVIAGGTDVLVQVREGRHAGRRLVSIHGIGALRGIAVDADGAIVIGPLCTFAEVTESAIIQKYIPALGFATGQAGGPQLRNAGTVGGNVCNGVTSADSASTLLTLNAELEITGPGGVRRQSQEHFYRGPGQVALENGELLTAIRIARADYDGFFGCYIKYAQRNAMDIATLGTAVHVRLTPDKKAVDELRLAFGVAAPTPIRCRAAEQAAKGQRLCEALLDNVAQSALGEVSPRTSWRASKEFRLQLVYENSKRALREAIARAGGAVL